jgi:ferrochelatase
MGVAGRGNYNDVRSNQTGYAMPFRKEPSHTHGTSGKTAVVLVNLGTPEAPTAAAVRPYLREFLSDPRVVEIPRAIWWCILNLLILPFRSGKSAAKYATIWTSEGSPLRVHTEKQATLLRGYLGQRGHAVSVVYAMRYGQPSVPDVLEKLKADGCDRVLILPAYPQYSATTSASIFDAVFAHYRRTRNVPELRFIKHYHDHPGYLDALAQSVRDYWAMHGLPDKLVMSFHGTPKRTLLLGDPYFCECHKSGRLLAARLGLQPDQYTITFQSRFGKAEWLQPYTQPTLELMGKAGVGRVDVICPGFIGDCLETLEEISMEVREAFLHAGGREFHYITCLNESPAWIAGMADLVEQHLAGWQTLSTPASREADGRAALETAAQAKQFGASH